MEWYREYEHIGYNLEGKKIIKPPAGDELDNFLNKMDNPDYWSVDEASYILHNIKNCFHNYTNIGYISFEN